MGRFIRIASFSSLALVFTLFLMGVEQGNNVARGGGCGSGAGSGDGVGDDDDNDDAASDGSEPQAFILCEDATCECTDGEECDLSAVVSGAESDNVVWQIGVSTAGGSSLSASFSALALGLDLDDLDLDDAVEVGGAVCENLTQVPFCDGPRPGSGAGVAGGPGGGGGQGGGGGSGDLDDDDSDDDEGAPPPAFLAPPGVQQIVSNPIHRAPGKIEFTPTYVEGVQTMTVCAMSTEHSCYAGEGKKPSECLTSHPDDIDCATLLVKTTFQAMEKKADADGPGGGGGGGGGGGDPLAKQLCDGPWQKTTTNFQNINGQIGGLGWKSCLNPNNWQWCHSFENSEGATAACLEIIKPTVSYLELSRKTGGCPIDEPQRVCFTSGTCVDGDSLQLGDLFADDLIDFVNGNADANNTIPSSMRTALKAFLPKCAAAFPDNPTPAGTMSALGDTCVDEMETIAETDIPGTIRFLEAVLMIPSHLSALSFAMLDYGMVRLTDGAYVTIEDITGCIAEETTREKFVKKSEGKGEVQFGLGNVDTLCHGGRVNSCQAVADQKACESSYTQICQDSAGNTVSCTLTHSTSDFHNCFWGTVGGQTGCWYYGSAVGDQNCYVNGSKNSCGDGLCNTKESSATCPTDCW